MTDECIPLTETDVRARLNEIRDPNDAIKLAVKAARHPKGALAMNKTLEALSRSGDLTDGIMAATYEIAARKYEKSVRAGNTNDQHNAEEARRVATLFKKRRDEKKLK